MTQELNHHDPQQDAQEHDELAFNTTPNYITAFRVVMVPVIIWAMFLQTPLWDFLAAIIFALASISDFFDGYLARAQKRVTIFGKLMDPLADKFLVSSTLIMLLYLNRINPIVVILLICREFAITGLRGLASAEGLPVIAASASAKWKTATQMIAIPWIILRYDPWGIPLYNFGQVLLVISVGISLWSAQDYIVEFVVALKKRAKEKREARIARREQRRNLKS